MPTATSTLQASLEKHNETFETLLSLIPAKYYLVRDDNNDQVGFHCLVVRAYMPTELPQGTSRYHKNKKGQQAPKQAIKEASKKARREKVRSSVSFPFDVSIIDGAQLNPANNKNILDIQNDQLTANSKGKHKASAPNDSDVDVLSGEADFLMQDAESDPEENASHDVSLSQPESIETLRAKLHAKIEAMRSKKRGDAEGNSKDELLEERRLHRAAMRERRRKETKAKIQREKERKGKTKENPKESAPPAKVSQLG
jgi:hypothetical protein